MSTLYVVTGHPDDHGGSSDVPVLIVDNGSVFVLVRRSVLPVERLLTFATADEARAASARFPGRTVVAEIETVTETRREQLRERDRNKEQLNVVEVEEMNAGYTVPVDGLKEVQPGRAPKPETETRV